MILLSPWNIGKPPKFIWQYRPVFAINSRSLGNSVMVARLALDQLVGVRIPVPQFFFPVIRKDC